MSRGPRRRFRVRWAEVAVRDLEEIVSYVAVDSDANASRVLTRIETRAAALESSPSRGRVVPELAHFGMRTWRELVVRPYRLVHRIEGDTVTVLAIFDGRRDLDDVLLERLLGTP
jgi:plasmid stabilization system protein ParE